MPQTLIPYDSCMSRLELQRCGAGGICIPEKKALCHAHSYATALVSQGRTDGLPAYTYAHAHAHALQCILPSAKSQTADRDADRPVKSFLEHQPNAMITAMKHAQTMSIPVFKLQQCCFIRNFLWGYKLLYTILWENKSIYLFIYCIYVDNIQYFPAGLNMHCLCTMFGFVLVTRKERILCVGRLLLVVVVLVYCVTWNSLPHARSRMCWFSVTYPLATVSIAS